MISWRKKGKSIYILQPKKERKECKFFSIQQQEPIQNISQNQQFEKLSFLHFVLQYANFLQLAILDHYFSSSYSSCTTSPCTRIPYFKFSPLN